MESKCSNSDSFEINYNNYHRRLILAKIEDPSQESDID